MTETVFDRLRSGVSVGRDDPDIQAFDDAAWAAYRLRTEYNSTPWPDRRSAQDFLARILHAPLQGSSLIIPPFQCDLGFNIHLGKDVLVNYDCILLDCAEITIGDRAMIAPQVKIVTASHPLDPHLREDVPIATVAQPVTIGKGVWIGTGAVILPGRTIGDGAVVGAGAVVTHDVPPDTVVAGNPARVLRQL